MKKFARVIDQNTVRLINKIEKVWVPSGVSIHSKKFRNVAVGDVITFGIDSSKSSDEMIGCVQLYLPTGRL